MIQKDKQDQPLQTPLTGAEKIPPGATHKAFERPENPPGGPPGSGAGERHAIGDLEDESMHQGPADNPEVDPTLPPDEEEEGGYGGVSGGAVGGTPAGKRSRGGRVAHGFDPGGAQRGDTTIGADPDSE
jgi:hypothetical protein